MWRGETPEYRRQWQLKEALANISRFSPEAQELLRDISSEQRAALESLHAFPSHPTIEPLLDHLLAVGLVTAERTKPGDTNPNLTCHELVRERIQNSLAAQPKGISNQTADAVRLAYAEWLEYNCTALLHKDKSLATEAGRRAIVYYVQAHAYERLGSLVGNVVTGGADAKLLESLFPYLEQAVQAAPAGSMEWIARGYLADAFRGAGHLADSLLYYEQAATLAYAAAELDGEAAKQTWTEIGWLTNNWSIALRDNGQLRMARQQLMASAEAKEKAGSPAIFVIGTKLEALRLDVMQGQAKQVRPQIEDWLAQIQIWWQRQKVEYFVPEAPDSEMLARALLSALDIANDADRAQGDWASALTRSNKILEVERDLGRSAEEIAVTRLNRAAELQNLGPKYFAEAQSELEYCLSVFTVSSTERANTLSALAILFSVQGDYVQAIIQEKRALYIREEFSNPDERAVSHANMSVYLEKSTQSAKIAQASKHLLAALLYLVVAELNLRLQTLLYRYIVTLRHAQATGIPPAIPRVVELLADPAFRPLAEWLSERQVDRTELQAWVDNFLDQARQTAANNP